MIYIAWHHDNITQPATTGDQKDKAQSLLIYHDIRQSHITRVSLCHSYYIPPINLYGCVIRAVEIAGIYWDKVGAVDVNIFDEDHM